MASRAKPVKRVSVVEENNTKIDVPPPSYKDVVIIHKNELNEIPKGPKFGCRHVQIILLSLAMLTGIATRTNLSVAIVVMTDNSTSPNKNVPTYDWNDNSVILSSFFWSYISLQILAGYIGKTYGPKYFLLTALFLNNCACAGTPMAAERYGSIGVIICRVIQGFTQGFLYPSTHVMLGTWAPDNERATLNNIVFMGVSFGSVFASLLTGYISASWLGWPYSFYIMSMCGFAWCFLWLILGQNSPATHPRITPEEKHYIQNSLKQEGDDDIPIPWAKIFTCIPFYALLVAYVGNIWGYAVLMTESPTYLAKVMQFDVKSNAVANAIPVPFGVLAAMITGPASDWLISNNYMSTVKCRKICQGIGSFGHALCLVWLSLLTQKEAKQSYVVLSLSSILSSFIMVGSNVNHLDLSPRFSGILFGILNATGQLASVAAPLFAQWIIQDSASVAQWRILFLISVGFYVAGATVFLIFGSATRQEWDGPENNDMIERKKKISVISFSSMM